MKTFLFKWLIALQKKRDQGFTIVELVVVLVILGILATIVAVAGFGQVSQARIVEARNNIANLSRAQQAFLVQRGRFADTIAELQSAPSSADTPAGSETASYTYDMQVGSDVIINAVPRQPAFTPIAGRVFLSGEVPLFVICDGTQGTPPTMSSVQSPSDCPNN
jgi:prepilin-type N-terminal cleavage/methylation domain-containing protein